MDKITEICGRLRPNLTWEHPPAEDGDRHKQMPLLVATHPSVRLRLRADVLDFGPEFVERLHGALALGGLGYSRDASGRWVTPKVLPKDAHIEAVIDFANERTFDGTRRVAVTHRIDLSGREYPAVQACGLLYRYHGILEPAPPASSKDKL